MGAQLLGPRWVLVGARELSSGGTPAPSWWLSEEMGGGTADCQTGVPLSSGMCGSSEDAPAPAATNGMWPACRHSRAVGSQLGRPHRPHPPGRDVSAGLPCCSENEENPTFGACPRGRGHRGPMPRKVRGARPATAPWERALFRGCARRESSHYSLIWDLRLS